MVQYTPTCADMGASSIQIIVEDELHTINLHEIIVTISVTSIRQTYTAASQSPRSRRTASSTDDSTCWTGGVWELPGSDLGQYRRNI